MKKRLRHNHTKTIIILIIALLGLYVVAIKSMPMPMGASFADNQMRYDNSEALRNKLALYRQLLQQERDATRRAQLQQEINRIEAELRRRNDSSLMRPKS